MSSCSFTGSAPRRIVPPMSRTSFCSGRRSTTGNGVSGSNSVELAPSMPATWRANSATAICMPRQMPRYGTPFSRAYLAAWILPSMPRSPKPPGIRIPSHCSSSSTDPSASVSDSIQRTSTLPPWWSAAVVERLDHRQVGVLELGVLAHQADPDLLARLVAALDQALPPGQVGRLGLDPEPVEDLVVHALGAEVQRHLVDAVHVAGRHHRVDRQVHEQRDLLPDVARERLLAAAHDHVRLDADPAQLLDGVLGGLGLELAGVAQERHQRQVQEHARGPCPRRPGTGAAPPGTAATRCRRPCRRSR